jgi:hypothetical protein
MAKKSNAKARSGAQATILKGWKQIAEFLGEPVSVAKRWRGEGMPVREQGRLVSSSADELTAWLGRESGKPVHVVTGDRDLSSELKRSLAFARQRAKS